MPHSALPCVWLTPWPHAAALAAPVHAWLSAARHALLLAAGVQPLKHSVLYVDFDPAAPCPLLNAQAAEPATALRQLDEGSSWAVLLRCSQQARSALDWIMRVRHHPSSMQSVLIALVDDPSGPVALNALRAGADAVLGATCSAGMLQAQLARMRERVAPVPSGSLLLAPQCILQASTRELVSPHGTLALSPQAFRLLWALAMRPGHVLSAAALRVALDIPARADIQALHTAVGKLRRLLRPHGLDGALHTVHGSGYRWNSGALLEAAGIPGTQAQSSNETFRNL